MAVLPWEQIESNPVYQNAAPERKQAIYQGWKRDYDAQPAEGIPTRTLHPRQQMSANAQPVEYDRNVFGDIASHFGRGVVRAAKVTGGMLANLDMDPRQEDRSNLFDRAGEALKGWSDRQLTENKLLRPDKAEAEEGFVKRGLMGIAESLPMSLVPITAGLGAAAAATFGGAPLAVASAIGTATGSTALLGTFGLGTYNERYGEGLNEILKRNPEMGDEEAREKAHRYALKHASFETITEFAQDALMLFTFGGSRVLTQPLKATIKQFLGDGTKREIAKRFAKNYVKYTPFEVGGEMIAGAGQAAADREIGVSDMSSLQAAMESIIPAMGLSLVLGGAFQVMPEVRAKRLMTNLNDVNNPAARTDAAEQFAEMLDKTYEEPELAKLFKKEVNGYIQRGEKVDYSEQIVDFARAKVIHDEATAIDPAPKARVMGEEELAAQRRRQAVRDLREGTRVTESVPAKSLKGGKITKRQTTTEKPSLGELFDILGDQKRIDELGVTSKDVEQIIRERAGEEEAKKYLDKVTVTGDYLKDKASEGKRTGSFEQLKGVREIDAMLEVINNSDLPHEFKLGFSLANADLEKATEDKIDEIVEERVDAIEREKFEAQVMAERAAMAQGTGPNVEAEQIKSAQQQAAAQQGRQKPVEFPAPDEGANFQAESERYRRRQAGIGREGAENVERRQIIDTQRKAEANDQMAAADKAAELQRRRSHPGYMGGLDPITVYAPASIDAERERYDKPFMTRGPYGAGWYTQLEPSALGEQEQADGVYNYSYQVNPQNVADAQQPLTEQEAELLNKVLDKRAKEDEWRLSLPGEKPSSGSLLGVVIRAGESLDQQLKDTSELTELLSDAGYDALTYRDNGRDVAVMLNGEGFQMTDMPGSYDVPVGDGAIAVPAKDIPGLRAAGLDNLTLADYHQALRKAYENGDISYSVLSDALSLIRLKDYDGVKKIIAHLVAQRLMPDPNGTMVMDEAMGDEDMAEGTVDIELLIQIIGAKMYKAGLADVSIKEMVQNAYDAIVYQLIRGRGKNKIDTGKIDIVVDPENRLISVRDNGRGMDPSVIKNAFLKIAGTDKGSIPSEKTVGKYGMAKAAFLYSNVQMLLRTVKDGKGYYFKAEPLSLFKQKVPIEKYDATGQPNGTLLVVKIPETIDVEGEAVKVAFPNAHWDVPSLSRPLLNPKMEITFTTTRTWNGEPVESIDDLGDPNHDVWGESYAKTVLPLGKNFDPEAEGYTKVKAPFKPDWGSVDIYIKNEKSAMGGMWAEHQVLLAGLYQFEDKFVDFAGEKAPYDIIVNLHPKVKATSAKYPVDVRREGWKPTIEKDVEYLKAYINMLVSERSILETNESFSNLHSVPTMEFYDVGLPASVATEEVTKIEEKASSKGKKRGTRKKKKFEVSSGKEKGTTEIEIEVLSFDGTELIRDFGIDERTPVYHNNTNVDWLEEASSRGHDIHTFFAEIGAVMNRVRDELEKVRDQLWEEMDTIFNPDTPWQVGVSIDKGYHGSSTKDNPFNGFMLNPFLLKSNNVPGIAWGYYQTIVHEFSHAAQRNHYSAFYASMDRALALLAGNGAEVEIREALAAMVKKHKNLILEMADVLADNSTKNSGDSIGTGESGNAAVEPGSPASNRGGGAARAGDGSGNVPPGGRPPRGGYNTGGPEPSGPNSYRPHRGSVGPRTSKQRVVNEQFSYDSMTAWESLLNFFTPKTFNNWMDARRNAPKDMSLANKHLALPLHSFKVVPALERTFRAAMERPDNFHSLVDSLSRENETMMYNTQILDAFSRLDPAGFKVLREYMVNRDLWPGLGYRVHPRKEDGKFVLRGMPDARKTTKKKAELGAYDTEDQAWRAAWDHEGQMLKDKHGWTREQVAALRAARDIGDAGYKLQVSDLNEARRLAAEIGHADSSEIIKTITQALKEMGDRRGSFFPRIRKPGSWLMYAVLPKDDIEAQKPPKEWTGQEVMIPAETKAGWANLKTWHEKQGYHVRDISRSKNLPEDVFELAGTTIKMQSFLDAALDKIALGDDATWGDMGVESGTDENGRATYSTPDPEKTGLTLGTQRKIFKEYGGEYDSAMQRWVFGDMSADKDQRMREAMLGNLADDAGKMMKVRVGEMIARNISNMHKARGARVHMMRRSTAEGPDVVRGYEEDPAIAFTKYVKGLAAGEAKKQSAIDMVNAFTGRDISYEEWLTDDWEKGIDQNTGLEKNSFYDWTQFTKGRRVDPVQSPVAFGEGISYIRDQLRNQEAADRMIGKLKSVAVLKYLGFRFLSAPLINMTAMLTNAPATISGYGEVPLSKAVVLLGKAYVEYGKFVNFKGMKNLGNETGDQFKRRVMQSLGIDSDTYDLYRIIERNKWDEAQYNREALEGLQGAVGKNFNKFIDFAMLTFGLSERMNRVGTILAGFRATEGKTMIDARNGKERKMTVDDRAKMAKEMMSDTAHAIYGKTNRPSIARGTNLTARIFQLFYVFQTFLHNSMNTMADLHFSRKQRKAAAWMLVMPSILAGGGASWLTKKMIKEVGKMLGDGDDPEENFYNYMDKEYGEWMSDLTRYGLAGMGGYGVNLKGSLENMSYVPTSLGDLLGAPGSMFFDVWKGGKDIAQGDVYRGVERMAPLAAQSALKGIRERSQGLTTSSNMPIFWGNERATATQADMWLRIFGFNPARVSKIKEVQWHDRMAEENMRQESNKIMSRARAYMLRPPEERTKAEWLDILDDIADYNAIAASTRIGVSPITPKRLRANLKRAFTPPKRERLRDRELDRAERRRETR